MAVPSITLRAAKSISPPQVSLFSSPFGNSTAHPCYHGNKVNILRDQIASPPAPAVVSPQSAISDPTPTPNRRKCHFDITSAQAVVRMFGNINHFHPSRSTSGSGSVAEALCFPAHVFGTLHHVSKFPYSPLLSHAATLVLKILGGAQVCVLAYRA
jgi:hypothetical protein